MDSTPVKRSANCNQDFANPHFKPLWEPHTTVGGNAIRYSLAHHVFQSLISNAGLCGFCTDELTRRVSEVARRLKTNGLFHDDRAHMDLFWQNASDGALVAGETIVTVNKHGEKIAVADYALELSREISDQYWWSERWMRFLSEVAKMDLSEARGPRGMSWFGSHSSHRSEAMPWETRFLAVIWSFKMENVVRDVGGVFVRLQETYLNFIHHRCQCVDVQRLRSGVSFETILMERVIAHISPSVWRYLPFPPEDIWRDKRRFLAYLEEHSSGIRREESGWDYAFSRGEIVARDSVVPRPLPRGWHRRWVSNNTVWYHDSQGRLISRGEYYSFLPNVSSAAQGPTVDEEEDLIEL